MDVWDELFNRIVRAGFWLVLGFALVIASTGGGRPLWLTLGFVALTEVAVFAEGWGLWRAVRQDLRDGAEFERAGRGLCHRCGYTISYHIGRCPECGTMAKGVAAGCRPGRRVFNSF